MEEQHKKEKGELQNAIDEKSSEIEKVRQEFENNYANLQSEKEKADSCQKELQHASIELAKKSDRVQHLEEELQKWEVQLEQHWEQLYEIAIQAGIRENEVRVRLINFDVIHATFSVYLHCSI